MAAAFAWLSRHGVAVALGAVALATSPLSEAQSRSAMLAVSAIVVPSTKVDVVASASTLEVTADDLKRGYVDVRDAARLRVTSTSRAGYRVDLSPRLAMFRALELRVDGLRARLGPDGGTLVAAGRAGRAMPARVDVRIELADGIAPGRYPLPFAIEVRPL